MQINCGQTSVKHKQLKFKHFYEHCSWWHEKKKDLQNMFCNKYMSYFWIIDGKSSKKNPYPDTIYLPILQHHFISWLWAFCKANQEGKYKLFVYLHSQTNFICNMKTFPVRKCTQTILGLFLRSLLCQSFDSLLVCLQAQIHPAQSQQQDRGDAERFSTQSRFTWKQYKTMVRNTSSPIQSVELHSQKILERMRLWEGFQIYFKWC